MILRLLLAFLAVVFLAAVGRLLWLRYGAGSGRPSSASGPASGGAARVLVTVLLAGMLALVFIAILTGRLYWIVTVPAALLLFGLRLMRYLPLMQVLRRLGLGGSSPFGRGPADRGPDAGPEAGDGRSRIDTRTLCMSLDHASGRLDGEVLEGPFAGRRLDALTRSELLRLHAQCASADPDAARLLETYLDRREGPDWRTDAGAGPDASGGSAAGATAPGSMSRAEALAVLGLDGEPDRDTVVRAHRRLMQQFHPDRGGSDHLAALLNRARDRLLDGAG